ncbi:MAG: FAD-dependent oxidoreductase [Deinococcota bacterium]|nr:FAD-dependent oxidoreductase [Deinococcota bacterium]
MTVFRACLLVWLFFSLAVSQQETAAGLKAAGSEVDVLVLGSEPEGVMAAVAAAQEGARTVLVTLDARLGGLFVTGKMNFLDLRSHPGRYQRGLFEAWWDRVGRRSSFDVRRAEEAFEAMLREARVEVIRSAGSMTPMLEAGRVRGVRLPGRELYAAQTIDATADADIAASAGAAYTVGFASLGLEARMADTLVLRIDGVDWPQLRRGIKGRGDGYAQVNPHAAWGPFGGYPAAYGAAEPGIRLRGLNLGLQEDGSVLMNALLIYGIDPFDPASRAEGKARAEREAPRIVAYLRELPGFAGARFGGAAETLYIRETRHTKTLCTLSVDDVMDNVVTELDVVAGGYPLDVQTLTPDDSGFVYGLPSIYGARLCVAVPEGVDNLWIAGKAAGYDPLAASSARVVPFGMALAEAVGVAAAQAVKLGLSTSDFAKNPERIFSLRERLRQRGAYLPAVRPRAPSGPFEHEFWEAYRVLRQRGLALGGYENNPRLDDAMPALSYAYLLSNVGRRFHGNDALGKNLLGRHGALSGPLTPELALTLTKEVACELNLCPERDWQALRAKGLAPKRFPPQANLTRGEAYALAAALAGIDAGATALSE